MRADLRIKHDIEAGPMARICASRVSFARVEPSAQLHRVPHAAAF